jgi:hypothetical protein
VTAVGEDTHVISSRPRIGNDGVDEEELAAGDVQILAEFVSGWSSRSTRCVVKGNCGVGKIYRSAILVDAAPVSVASFPGRGEEILRQGVGATARDTPGQCHVGAGQFAAIENSATIGMPPVVNQAWVSSGGLQSKRQIRGEGAVLHQGGTAVPQPAAVRDSMIKGAR